MTIITGLIFAHKIIGLSIGTLIADLDVLDLTFMVVVKVMENLKK